VTVDGGHYRLSHLRQPMRCTAANSFGDDDETAALARGGHSEADGCMLLSARFRLGRTSTPRGVVAVVRVHRA
jgi:hypothetical protein